MNVLLNDRFFTKEIVNNMFDLKVRTKFNKLRYTILKEYMKKNEIEGIERDISEINIITDNYMNFYQKRFNQQAYQRNLAEAEERNISFRNKYREEKEMIKEFKESKKFPENSYPMSFNNFIKSLVGDVRDEIENLKEQDKKMFKIK